MERPTHKQTAPLFFDRELSQLAFNRRVLMLAKNKAIPLLNRLRYLFITSNNLDEFFEVRVANLKNRLFIDKITAPDETEKLKDLLHKISLYSHECIDQLFECYNDDIYPALTKENIYFLKQHDWTADQRAWIDNYFEEDILPVISPIALDVAHPFPKLLNKNLNFIVHLSGKDAFGRESGRAVVHVPRSIPRLIPVPERLKKEGEQSFFLLSSIIKAHVGNLFSGMEIKGCYQFRIIRNSDLLLDDNDIIDLPMAVKTGLIEHRFGLAVRLDIEHDCPDELADYLLEQHHLEKEDLFHVNGQVNFNRLSAILDMLNRSDLCYPPLHPHMPEILTKAHDLFALLKQEDILLYHPYQSFEPIVELVRQASLDPNVITIKQTLYRTNADSAIVNALVTAARAGIEVTAIIELRARFDEEHNILLARRLQDAGAIVVYGIVGYKTHAKMLLILRREDDKLHRYVHLGTGNYHEKTAKEYTDLSLLTAEPEMTHDVQLLFQELMGMGKAIKTAKIWHAPFTIVLQLEKMIAHETEQAAQGKKALIIFKINALTDPAIIELLYTAAEAGVNIHLIVRGMCTLIPERKHLSKRIQVRSIMGRFLEHSRVYYFYHSGHEKIYCASADLMERNLYHRFEICFPVLDRKLAQRIKYECLDLCLADNVNAWLLDETGKYHLAQDKKHPPLSAQDTLLAKYAALSSNQ